MCLFFDNVSNFLLLIINVFQKAPSNFVQSIAQYLW